MAKDKAPFEVEVILDVSEDETSWKVEIKAQDGLPISPQMVVDSVVDALTLRYGMSREDWESPPELLDS
jgi:hypothetical protein